MNDLPLISVIIPLFNAEKYIGKTIQTISKQTYKNIEIIVVDDKSTDGSCAIVEKCALLDNRLILIELEVNSGGPAHPRNIGIKHANGEYIAFIDSDDLWMQNKLEEQYNFMIQDNFNFSSTGMEYINEENERIKNYSIFSKINSLIQKRRTIKDLIDTRFIATSSVLILKSFLIDFDESKVRISVEDYFLWLHLLNNENVRYGYLNDKLLQYRILDNSISDRKNPYKHEIKTSIATLTFILETNNFDYFTYFVKILIRNSFKRKFKYMNR